MTFPAGGGFPMGAAGGVPGYSVEVGDDGGLATLTATNDTTGAVLYALELDAPTGIAGAQSGVDVEVTIDAGAGAGYWTQIQRRAVVAGVPGAWSTIGHTAEDAASYTDAGVPPGTYQYRARNASATGLPVLSAYSAASANVAVVGVPVLTANPSTGTVPIPWVLSWTAIDGATEYQVIFRQALIDPPNVVITTAATSVEDTAGEPFDGYISVRVSQPYVGTESNKVYVDFN